MLRLLSTLGLVLTLLLPATVQAQVVFRSTDQSSSAGVGTGIAYGGAGTVDSRTGAGSINPGLPAGTAAGDLLIAQVLAREEAATVTMPGWNLLFDETPVANYQTKIYWRIATGGDSTTVTQAGTTNSLIARITRYTGVDQNVPILNGGTVGSPVLLPAANSNEQAAADVRTGTETTVAADAMLVIAAFNADNSSPAAPPGACGAAPAFTTLNNAYVSTNTAGNDSAIWHYYGLQTTAGLKGAFCQGQNNGNDQQTGVLFALNPAPAGALTINVPAGTTTDDVMIASIAMRPCNAGAGACTTTITPPAGWTQVGATIDQTTGGGTGNRMAIYQRTVTGAEPANYTWTIGGTPAHSGAVGVISSYSGVDTANPIAAEAGQATASSGSHAAPSLNTGVVTNVMLISAHATSSAVNWVQPGGMTPVNTSSSIAPENGGGISMAVYLETFVGPGVTGLRAATYDTATPGADTGTAHMLALRPKPVLPTLISASLICGATDQVEVLFSIPVTTPTAQNPANYALDGGATVSSAVLGADNRVVTLTTSALAPDQLYTLTVNNVASASDGAVIAANSQTTFYSSGGYLSGLLGNYFANMTLTGVPVQRVDGPLDFDWGNGTPGVAGIGADNFSVRWQGFVMPSTGGDYTFRTNSDDGVRLYIDGNLVIDNWTDHAPTINDSAPVTLTAGQRHAVVMEFYENGGGAVAQLSWSGPGTGGFQFIPRSSLSYFCGSPRPVAFYKMDETTWTTPGAVTDSSGNSNNGSLAGAGVAATPTLPVPPDSAIAGSPGTCGAGNFPGGGGTNAVATPVNPGASLGGRGTIAFWYASNTAWNAGGSQQMLFDASNNLGTNATDKHFLLAKQANGSLVFNLEDSGDTDTIATTGVNGFAANTWHHVAAVWDLGSDRTYIYIDGVLSATSTTNVNGTLGNTNTLYLGDSRNGAGITATGLTTNGVNGYLDEVRIYDRDLSATEIAALMSVSRPCSTIDHFSITHAGSGIACDTQTVTITAHDATHAPINAGTSIVNLSTSNGKGTWIAADAGTLSAIVPGAGTAQYTFAGASSVNLTFRYADLAAPSEMFNFNVSGGAISETTGTATAGDDQVFTMAQAGFRFRNINDGTDTMPAQISGKPSNVGYNARTMRLQAIRTDAATLACAAAFPAAATRNVELGAECNNPATCAGQLVSITNNAVTTNIPTSNSNGGAGASAYYTTGGGVPLNFNANSEADVVIAYPDAGQISLHARYDLDAATAGYEMAGSLNPFVVRPFGLAFPGIGHSNTETGAALAAAGDNFAMTVQAYQWASGEDADNDGIPDSGVNITDNGTVPNFAATATVTGTANLPGIAPGAISRAADCLSPPTIVLAGGTASAGDWCYNEVGNVFLAASVSNYITAGIDINGNSGLDGTGNPGGHVGRFRPKRFAVSGASLNNRTLAACASGFSYMDEGLTLEFTLTAQNTQGNPTSNYNGVYARHDPTAGGSNNAATAFAIGARNVAPFAALTARATGTYVASPPVWSNGVLGVTGSNAVLAVISRPTPDSPPDGPYNQVQFGIAPTDPDGVLMTAYNLDVDNSGGDDRTAIPTATTTTVRYGRLRLGPDSGSQILSLELPVEVQYWSGTFWITNVDDNCTSLMPANVGLGNHQLPLNPGETVVTAITNPLSAGRGSITLSAPGSGNSGSVDVAVNLGPVPPGAGAADACPAFAPAATAANKSYLRGQWCGATATKDPSARARFGIRGGSSETIYRRESFN